MLRYTIHVDFLNVKHWQVFVALLGVVLDPKDPLFSPMPTRPIAKQIGCINKPDQFTILTALSNVKKNIIFFLV